MGVAREGGATCTRLLELFLITLLPGAVPLAAQDGALPLEGLVVTAAPTARSIDAVANHVTILSGDRLHALGVRSLADALRDVPGLDVVRGGSFGSVTSVFLRGAESDHTLVLVDGVQVNQAGGGFDFEAVSTDNVERVEIVRGPTSALYGSDAVAGVVHVITRQGRGSPAFGISLDHGSYGRRSWRGSFQSGSEAAGYSLSVSRERSDGLLAFNNGHVSTTASGLARVRADDRTDVRVTLRVTDREYHFPTDGSGAVVDTNAFTFEDAVTAGIDVARTLSDRLSVEVAVGLHDTDGGTDDAQDGPADSLGFYGFTSLDDFLRANAEVRLHAKVGAGIATIAYEYEEQRQRSFTASESAFGPSSGRSDSRRTNHAAIAHLSGAWGSLGYGGGVRLEENERFGSSASWQAGVSWLVHDAAGTRLRGVAGRAIKEPTFFESFATGFAVGNPELEPERSLSWEVGLEQPIVTGVTLRSTWFDQSLLDLIQYTFTPPTPGGPNYFNVAEASTRGIEVDLGVRRGRIHTSASWTWLDSKVVDAGFDEGPAANFVRGEALLRRPRHRLSLRTRVALGVGSVEASYSLVGARSDRDFSTFPATAVALPRYGLLGLGGSWTVHSGPGTSVSFEARGENLLNASYQEVFGFSAPGRGLYVGARVGFGGAVSGR